MMLDDAIRGAELRTANRSAGAKTAQVLVFMSAYLRRFTRGRAGVSAEVSRRVHLAYAVAFVGAILLLPMLGVDAPDPAAGESPVMWEISMTIVYGLVVLYLRYT